MGEEPVVESGKMLAEPRTRHGMVALESEGEARRNRLLRRIDWRFLAGKPWPRRCYVPGGGMLAEALRQVAQQGLADSPSPESADLAALINPDQAALEKAWEVLEPGGVLYSEWYFPRLGGAGAHNRNLEKLGFIPAGSYWPWPWPERATPAFWLPLEAPGAAGYFLASRPPIHSMVGRVARLALQLAWRTGQRLRLLAPVCSVAYKPAGDGAGLGLPDDSLARRVAGWGLAKDESRPDWLLLTGGLHSTNKVTGLIFSRGEGAPRFVVKMPRREVSLPALQREADVLQTVRAGFDRSLEGIPELIFLDVQRDFPVLVETHLAGVPLYTMMRPDRLADLAQQGTRWLLRLVHPGDPQPPTSWWDRLVAPVLDEFTQGYASTGGSSLLEAVQAELSCLGLLPLAVEHRDFSPWNIFLSPAGGLSVLDWEGAEPRGLPFSDLLYFLTYLTFFAERALETGTAATAYRNMLDPQTRLGAIAAGCIQEYCRATGLSEGMLRPLRLLTWLRHAVAERKLIESSGDGIIDPKLLNRGLYLSLLRTELELKPRIHTNVEA